MLQSKNFGIGQVTHVDARTGVQRVVSQGRNLMRPVGIAVEENGQRGVARGLGRCEPFQRFSLREWRWSSTKGRCAFFNS